MHSCNTSTRGSYFLAFGATACSVQQCCMLHATGAAVRRERRENQSLRGVFISGAPMFLVCLRLASLTLGSALSSLLVRQLNKHMKRILGAVSGALRGLAPRAAAPAAPAAPNAAHQERVRKAMESLAPTGTILPSQGKALAIERTAADLEGKKMVKTPEEMYWVANALFEGKHVPMDKETAVKLWKQAADAGHPKATYTYAKCLWHGDGAAQDRGLAVSLFERLGDEGLPDAKHALGLVLSSGEGEDVGIPQDEKRALELFKSAVKGGFLPAVHAAASMMEAGLGGEKNGAEAVKWLETAIEAGDRLAPSTLATWYERGRAGLTVNQEKAYELHLHAANMGMPRAQYNAGVHYFEGKGVEQNLQEAAMWFEKAAALGVPQAMLNLGKMFENGIGVEQDRERALKWYQSGLRAEAQLEGAVAEFGDAAVANVMKQKRSKEKQAQIDRGGEA